MKKTIFPKKPLARRVWISGAIIELLGLFFIFSEDLRRINQNKILVGFSLAIIGLFVALSSRRIK